MEDLKWPCWLKINPRGFTSADGEGLGKGTLELSFFKADDDCSWLLRPSQRSWPGGLTNQDKVASIWGLQAMFPSIFNNCKIKFIAMVAVCETLTTCPACCQARYSMYIVISVQFGLSCVWLCNAMDCSMPGFPVLHHLLEFSQIRVHWVNDAIQSSHPLLSPSPPALILSQHQGLFQRVGSSHQVAKVLELHLQHQSFQWIFRVDFF